MKIDLKSLAVGMVVGVALAFTLGAVATQGEVGRYQIFGNENHIFVLETTTGRVWEKFVTSSQGETSRDFAGPKVGLPAE